MMKKPAILIFCVFVCITCKKGIQADNLFLRGRLFLFDTLTTNSRGVPLPFKQVFMAEDNGDTLNYRNSDTTDNGGYFLFALLSADKGKRFVLTYEDSANGYYYKGIAKGNAGDDNVQIVAILDSTRQNGMILSLLDSLGDRLPQMNIRVYDNPSLAAINDSTGLGASFSLQTNAVGIFYKLNFPAGTYYVNAGLKVDSIVYQRLLKKVTLSTTGFVSDTMTVGRIH